MHTNEEQNKPAPGQIAWNKAAHSTCELFENESGGYYPVCQRIETPGLIRSEYTPIGSRLQYPTKWGRKRAAIHLLEFKISDAQRQITDAQQELEKLRKCLDEVNLWDEDSKD